MRLAAILAVIAGVLASPLAAQSLQSCEPPRDREFRIFDATAYVGKPDMRRYGIEPVHVVDRGIWADGVGRAGPPDPALVRKYIDGLPRDGAPVVLDFEDFDFAGSDRAARHGMQVLDRIARTFQTVAPERQYGFYAMLPTRDYWRAINDEDHHDYREWHAQNQRIRSLERSVDLLFPSLYTFYPDQAGWEKFAIAQICEARRLSDKPVYAFIWPEYHGNGREEGGYVPADYWRRQLETVRRYADGVVIWGGYDLAANRPRQWNGDDAWWRETRAFLRRHPR